jgi:DNA-binding NarL/FixJ family response regulator
MTRVLLVDDHHVVRAGLRALLDLTDDIEVVGEAATAKEAIRRVGLDRPNVVVLDVRLPDGDGVATCREIRRRFPGVEVLILTSFADEQALLGAVEAGAAGFELKRADVADLVDDIRRVAAGDRLFTAEQLAVIDGETDPLLGRLSEQEATVAHHIAAGMTNREIADAMYLAEKTVKNYVSSVLTKMGMSRRSQVAAHVAQVKSSQPAPQSWDEVG